MEEDPAPISLQEPAPDEVADYVSTKQEQLTALEAKVCCKQKCLLWPKSEINIASKSSICYVSHHTVTLCCELLSICSNLNLELKMFCS